jgi:hypothetical protein
MYDHLENVDQRHVCSGYIMLKKECPMHHHLTLLIVSSHHILYHMGGGQKKRHMQEARSAGNRSEAFEERAHVEAMSSEHYVYVELGKKVMAA